MKQKKTCYFFCDIMGTFSTISEDNEQIKQFIDNLAHIKERVGSNELYLNFITSDNIEVLSENIKRIKPYIGNNNIKLGSQFCDETEINFQTKQVNPIKCQVPSRINIIKKYIEERGIDNIDMFILADDALMNTEILKMIWNKMNFDNSKLTTINPNKKQNLNECISEFLRENGQGDNGQYSSNKRNSSYEER